MMIGRTNRLLPLNALGFGSLIVMCWFCMPLALLARMSEISDTDLSRVSAQSGVTYVIGSNQMRITASSFALSDTDHDPLNWMEFNNVTVDDGNGGYFSMDTPEDYDTYNSMDVFTSDAGRTYVQTNLSTNVLPRTYTVGNFLFCGQDIGSLRLLNLKTGVSNKLTVGGRSNGSGIDLEYNTELALDSFRYSYNSQPASLTLSGIHLTGSASGDPIDPLAWTYAGKFKIGDLENNNPATIDIGTSTVDGTTSVYYILPMTGNLRVEKIEFGGANFGPCAIDGINVHRLGVRIGTN